MTSATDHGPRIDPPTPSRRTVLSATAIAVPAFVAVSTTPAFATSADSVLISLSPATVAAGETTTAIVTVHDGSGVAKAGRSVSLTSSSSSLTFSPAVGVTQSDGTFRSTVTVSGSASTGTSTVSAAVGGVTATAALTVKSFSLSVSVSPTKLDRGGSGTVVATVTDSGGAAAPGRTVAWTTSTSGVSFGTPTGTTDSSGKLSSSVISTTSAPIGDAVLVASVGATKSSVKWQLTGVTITLDTPKTMKVNTTVSFAVSINGSDRDVTYTTTYPDLIIGGIPRRGTSNTFTDKTVRRGSVLTLTASSSTQPGTATVTAVCSGGSAAFDIQIVAA